MFGFWKSNYDFNLDEYKELRKSYQSTYRLLESHPEIYDKKTHPAVYRLMIGHLTEEIVDDIKVIKDLRLTLKSALYNKFPIEEKKKIILTLSKEDDHFLVDDKSVSGSPPVGRGRTMMEAIGQWFHYNRERVNVDFELDPSAQQAEDRRRKRELSKR